MGSRWLVSEVARQDGEDNWGPYSFHVGLTAGVCQKVVRRHRLVVGLAKADKELWEMYYWDWGPGWSDATLADAEAGEAEEDDEEEDEEVLEGYSWLVRDVEPGFGEDDRAAVEVPQMAVSTDYVKWVAVPKHCNHYVETECIPVRVFVGALLEAAGRGEDKAGKGLLANAEREKGDAWLVLYDWLEENGLLED